MDSDTPRTDECWALDDGGRIALTAGRMRTLCSQLERELAQMRQEIVDLKCELVDAKASAECWADQCSQRVEDWDKMREALAEIRDRVKGHPAYMELDEEGEIREGGDTAELSYLARVADSALQEQK